MPHTQPCLSRPLLLLHEVTSQDRMPYRASGVFQLYEDIIMMQTTSTRNSHCPSAVPYIWQRLARHSAVPNAQTRGMSGQSGVHLGWWTSHTTAVSFPAQAKPREQAAARILHSSMGTFGVLLFCSACSSRGAKSLAVPVFRNEYIVKCVQRLASGGNAPATSRRRVRGTPVFAWYCFAGMPLRHGPASPSA